MITKEVNKFMALAPLMLPRLIDSKKCAEPDITEDSAILYFSLEEKFRRTRQTLWSRPCRC